MQADPGSREAVAARIEAVRRYYNVPTRKEFAEAAGISEQLYSDWMRLRRGVSRAAAEKLIDRYSLSFDFIFRGNKDALPHKMAMEL